MFSVIFSVILSNSFDTKNDTKITEKEKQVLTFIINNRPSKAIEISNALGFSITTIKNILYKLVDYDLVSSSGTIIIIAKKKRLSRTSHPAFYFA